MAFRFFTYQKLRTEISWRSSFSNNPLTKREIFGQDKKLYNCDCFFRVIVFLWILGVGFFCLQGYNLKDYVKKVDAAKTNYGAFVLFHDIGQWIVLLFAIFNFLKEVSCDLFSIWTPENLNFTKYL